MGELGNKASIDLHTAIDARTGTAGQAMAGTIFSADLACLKNYSRYCDQFWSSEKLQRSLQVGTVTTHLKLKFDRSFS